MYCFIGSPLSPETFSDFIVPSAAVNSVKILTNRVLIQRKNTHAILTECITRYRQLLINQIASIAIHNSADINFSFFSSSRFRKSLSYYASCFGRMNSRKSLFIHNFISQIVRERRNV